MNIDFLISRSGLRIEQLDVTVKGMRLAKGNSGFGPQSAETVTGAIRLALVDLAAALARPEMLDQLLAGVSGIAKPEVGLTNGPDGGVRITGSVEFLGRRIPISAYTDLKIVDNRIVVAPTRIDGLPLLNMLPTPLPDLVLPIVLPAGLEFTDVTTEPGAIVVSFAGTDIALQDTALPPEPTS